MTRPDLRLVLAALTAATLLSACGIKGDLATPPPLWGGGSDATVPEDNTAAESIEDASDPVAPADTPFDGEPFDDDDDRFDEYGVDVAD